ncbi:MAG: 50S ribosomal protein L25 [Minisyncoccia bacterium]
MITLSAEQRKGTPAELRANDQLPAVYYGKGSDAVSVAINAKEFIRVFKEAGESTAIALMVGGEKIPTIIKEIQRNAITGEPTHVDFLIIDMKVALEVAIPIEFTGEAEAEKLGLGNLMKALHELTVSALPGDLPHTLEVDVSGLATLEDHIKASDVKLPKGVTLVTEPEEMVALIAAFVEEKEEPVLDVNAIEVEAKGKKEEDDTAE